MLLEATREVGYYTLHSGISTLNWSKDCSTAAIFVIAANLFKLRIVREGN